MVVRFICPFLYSLLLGCVWSSFFKKKFSDSLAPAFMTHIILVLLGGLIFQRLSIGIYGTIALAVIAGIITLVQNRNSISRLTISQYLKKNWNEGIFIFSVFYVFCFFSNYGKTFLDWDEFSHWGMFLKESLRMDSLYCMSPLDFAHKDYVPAMTLFEVIWCKLSGRYAEPYAYRAIQIFMFSLLMPMFDRISATATQRIKESTGRKSCLKHRLFQLGAVLIVLLIPLVFNTNNAFYFYHSIYCDLAVGIVFFWCVFEACRTHESMVYQCITVTIGLTIMVLSKMTAMALLPLVIALFIVRMLFLNEESVNGRHFALMLPTSAVPVALWLWFNSFAGSFVPTTGSIQSYSGMKLSSIGDVFINPANSPIPYLKKVRDAYLDAIIHRDILIHGSYVVVILTISVLFLILSHFTCEALNRKKMILASVWTIVSGTFYALLMYFLYCTAFSENEAVALASYERYMNSFVITALFFLIAVYFDSDIWEKHPSGYYWFILVLFFDLSFFHIHAFDQVLPGTITHDEEKVLQYTTGALTIASATDDNDKILVLKRGDNGDYMWHLKYYCSPRTIDGGSIGPAAYDGDIWSFDAAVEEFVNAATGYDYIYFGGLDSAFIEKYSVAFADPALLVDGSIYRISGVDSQIHLEQTQ